VRKRHLGGAVLVLAASLALTSCSDSAKVGAAFTAGSARMSESELTSLIDESRKAQTDLGVEVSAAVDIASGALNAHIWQEIVNVAAAARKVTVTKTELSDILNAEYSRSGKKNVQGQLASIGYPPRMAEDYARLVLLQNKVSQQVAGGKTDAAAQAKVAKFWSDTATSLKITVAPRYGTWDSTALQVTPPQNPNTNPGTNGNNSNQVP
jgi:hypothetical protein